jgi:hypothetical protein
MSDDTSRRLADATGEQLIAGIRLALEAEDMPAVVAFLRALAVKEPRTAEIILDTINHAAAKS